MAVDRLVGNDGTLYRFTFGAPIVTGAPTDGALYKIVAKDGTTVFPAGFDIGDIWQGDSSKTFSSTNSASLVTKTIVSDCNGFSFDISAPEIDVTVLSDQVTKYRRGKADMSGTITGINFISEMRKSGSVLNRFLKVVVGDSVHNAAPTVNAIDGSDFYIQAYLNDDATIGESQVYLLGQVELFSYNLGAAIGDAQNWESSVRFIGNDPVVWILDNEAST